MRSTALLMVLVTAVSSLWGAFASAAQPDEPDRATMRLIAEHDSIVPGQTAWLGLAFEIDEDWHLYWNGANDSGFPITVEFTVPEGYKVGEFLWPVPMRHISEGDLLDHIYEKRVTLLVPLTVPASAQPGEKVPIKAEGNWLVCKTACIAGEGVGTLHLSVAKPDAKPARIAAHEKLFMESRTRLPRPLTPEKPEASLKWEGDRLTLKVHGAKGLAFYPERESADLVDLVRSGETTKDELALELADAKAGRIVGILHVNPQSPGNPTVYRIDTRRPGANPAGSGASHR